MQASDGQGQRCLQSGHAEGRFLKFDDLLLRRVGRVVGRDGIDRTIGSGVSRAGGATRDAMVVVGKKAKEGTKNALASAAGVRRTPMREWAPPVTDPSSPADE